MCYAPAGPRMVAPRAPRPAPTRPPFNASLPVKNLRKGGINNCFRDDFKRYLVSVSNDPRGNSWEDEADPDDDTDDPDPPKLVCPNASDPMDTTIRWEVFISRSNPISTETGGGEVAEYRNVCDGTLADTPCWWNLKEQLEPLQSRRSKQINLMSERWIVKFEFWRPRWCSFRCLQGSVADVASRAVLSSWH